MVMKNLRSFAFGLALLMALALAGCGSSGDHGHAANTPIASTGTGDAQEVAVTLSDFTITVSQANFVVGKPYRFVITNTSKTAHEFAIAPMMPMGQAMSDADMHTTALVHVDANELPTGKAKAVTYTFTNPAGSGELEFGCHIVGHYDAGMHAPITVA